MADLETDQSATQPQEGQGPGYGCPLADWMKLTSIRVECYAGYKADESPRRFFWQDRWVEIEEIVDRWHQGGVDLEWPVADYFRVVVADKSQYLLKHDLESGDWYRVTRM